jgi:hypothetical protein
LLEDINYLEGDIIEVIKGTNNDKLRDILISRATLKTRDTLETKVKAVNITSAFIVLEKGYRNIYTKETGKGKT